MKIWWTKIFFIENKSFNIESDVAFGIIKIEAKAFENGTHEDVYTFMLHRRSLKKNIVIWKASWLLEILFSSVRWCYDIILNG